MSPRCSLQAQLDSGVQIRLPEHILHLSALLSSIILFSGRLSLSTGKVVTSSLLPICLAKPPEEVMCLFSKSSRKSPKECFHWSGLCYLTIPGSITIAKERVLSLGRLASWAHSQRQKVDLALIYLLGQRLGKAELPQENLLLPKRWGKLYNLYHWVTQ